MTSRIQVLPGAEGIKSVYERSLSEKTVDVMCMSSKFEQVLGDYFDMEYAPKLYGKIKTREILPDTVENRDYAKGKDQKLNQVRFTQAEPTETDMLVGENWVGLVSFEQENPVAVVIEEPELVKAMKQQYELMWQGCK
jgi:hypothetical protein